MLFLKNGWGAVCLSAIFVLSAFSNAATAQIRRDKLFIDDGTGLFTILKSPHLSGGNQTVMFPNLQGGSAMILLSNSISGQTINGGLRVNGGLTLGTMLAAQYGGTGLDASNAANGQILIGNGNGFDLSEITGTLNQVLITVGPGTIRLSTPQDIGLTSSPTFSSIGLGSNGSTPVAGSVTLSDGTGPTGHSATLLTAPMSHDRTITIPDPGANASIVTTEGNQTINGNKTLTGTTGLTLLTGAGPNHFAGTQELTAGQLSVVVPNTAVTSASSITVTYEDLNDQDQVVPSVVQKIAGTSFTIRFSGPIPSGANARVHFMIINP